MKTFAILWTLTMLCLSASESRYHIIFTDDNKTAAYNTATESKRIYPYGDTLQPLLGYTTAEGRESAGMEEVTALFPQKWYGIRLTVNLALQQSVEQILDRYKRSLKADEILVGVMESGTGRMKVLASSNRYDPDTMAAADPSAMRQKFSDYTYEPGAVVMPLVMAAALERDLVEPGALIATGSKLVYANGRYVTDAVRTDLLTPEEILLNVSNIGIAKIAFRFSGYEFRESLEKFGLHRYCFIEFMHHRNGFLRSSETFEERMYRANTAYGYGMRASFVQMLKAYSAFNNDGRVVTPQLIYSVVDEKKEEVVGFVVPPAEAVGKQAAAQVHAMLAATVQKGLGQKANIPGLDVGGMGAVAYIVKGGKYVKEYHSSFYGFANDNRGYRYTIGVLVIRPKAPGQFYVSRSAVPVFGEVVRTMAEQGFLKAEVKKKEKEQ